MKNKINIKGQDYTVEELTTILENAKKTNPMDEVYAYHNTTEEEFNNLYKNIPNKIKAFAQESLIVDFYNKGWTPNWNDNTEKKWYPYFNMKDFSLYFCSSPFSSTSPASLVFKSEKLCIEAVEKYFDVFKVSRTTV